MNPDSMSEITRRTILVAMGGMAATAFEDRTTVADEREKQPRLSPFLSTTTEGRSKMPDIEKEYRRLLPLWQKEREQFMLSSSTYDYWKGPYGKAIIALGPAIIPWLIQELRKGDFFFNVPLALITNAEVGTDKPRISEQERAKLWLKWWENG